MDLSLFEILHSCLQYYRHPSDIYLGAFKTAPAPSSLTTGSLTTRWLLTLSLAPLPYHRHARLSKSDLISLITCKQLGRESVSLRVHF
jgi:hypothetical protein